MATTARAGSMDQGTSRSATWAAESQTYRPCPTALTKPQVGHWTGNVRLGRNLAPMWAVHIADSGFTPYVKTLTTLKWTFSLPVVFSVLCLEVSRFDCQF